MHPEKERRTLKLPLESLVNEVNGRRVRSSLMWEKENQDRYNVAGKPQDVFQAQLHSLFEPLVIPNFLSTDEIARLLQEHDQGSLTDYNTRTGVTEKKQGWGETEKSILKDRIVKLFGRCDVLSGTYHKLLKPYTPHVDLGKDPNIFPYANLLLPLKMSPVNATTHLVMFHQRYFGLSATFCAAPRKNPPHQTYNQIVTEYSGVLGLSPQSFDSKDREDLLSHCLVGDLEGLSISHRIPWEVGSLVVFDPTHIHASANFLEKGITEKTALTLSLGVQPL